MLNLVCLVYPRILLAEPAVISDLFECFYKVLYADDDDNLLVSVAAQLSSFIGLRHNTPAGYNSATRRCVAAAAAVALSSLMSRLCCVYLEGCL